MKRWFSILIPIFILSSLIVWRIGQKQAEIAMQMNMKAMKMKGPAIVSVSSVEIRDISSKYEATGNVEAPLNVKIAPKITGRINYLIVREGDRVRKGQVLVRIDSSEVEANVQQQMAALAEAQYRLAQAQMNQNPADVAVNTQIRQQKAGLSSANADVNQVRKTYDAQIATAKANLSDAQSKIENAKASVKGAEANNENSKAKFNRIVSLYKQGFIAAQDVDDAKAALSVQESALDIAKGQLQSMIAQKESASQQLNIVKAKGEADIEAARAKSEQARASLDYATASSSQKSAYKQSIAALRSSVAAAKASLQSAQARRQDAVLTSPLDGYVTGRYSDPGAIASPTQPIISVQFMKQVWVAVSVPEEVCAKLHIGQPSTIKMDAYPGKTFTASVVQINPSADPESRQFMVRVIMSNIDNKFKPGMFARVTLETGRLAKQTVVPREAIQKDKMGNYVITVDKDQKAKRIIVTPGAEDENYVCIGDALEPGQKVVTLSSMPIKDGQTVIADEKMRGKYGKKNGAVK